HNNFVSQFFAHSKLKNGGDRVTIFVAGNNRKLKMSSFRGHTGQPAVGSQLKTGPGNFHRIVCKSDVSITSSEQQFFIKSSLNGIRKLEERNHARFNIRLYDRT